MDYDYEKLVEAYVGKRYVDWEWYKRTVKRNFSDAEDTEDSDAVIVYIEELVSGQVGSGIMAEFCSWFGIHHTEWDDMEEIVWDFEKLSEGLAAWINKHKPVELTGEFSISFMEADGSLCVYYTVDKETLKFSDWRRSEGYLSWESMLNEELCKGEEYEDLSDVWAGVQDEFYQYCEGAHYIADMDED